MEVLIRNPSLANLIKANPNMEQMQYDNTCELYRISSYSEFPRSASVSERSLAKAGFYYTGVEDKVKCFNCGLMLDNWKKGDDATEKHKMLYPSCSFIQNAPSLNLGASAYSAFSPPSAQSPNQAASASADVEDEYIAGSYTSFPHDVGLLGTAEDLSHMRSNDATSTMSTEDARLATFTDWPLSFLKAPDLAKAGFYYIGPGDKVCCFSCDGKLNNWEPKDDAMSEHKRHFPDCPFVKSISSRAPARYSVSNVSMQTATSRIKTFVNWPPRIPVTPKTLSEAGFYYVGRNDDVKCFCCDGGLRCWESGDDPWVEHAKWFPRCEFLVLIKGQPFVDEIQEKYPHLLDQLLSSSEIQNNEQPYSPIIRLGSDTNSEDDEVMNTEVVQMALELGFSRRLVKETVQSKILMTGESYKDADGLISDILSAQEEQTEEERDRQAEETSVEQSLKSSDFSDLPMEEQLRKLQEEKICKICMDREVSIVFIPCGHLVVCQDCAPALRKCPICRGTIKGTVKTFLS